MKLRRHSIGFCFDNFNDICSLSESESASLLKEELLPLASTILRLNAKLRPQGRVSNTASCHLVAEFVMVVREFKSQLEVVTNKKSKVNIFF